MVFLSPFNLKNSNIKFSEHIQFCPESLKKVMEITGDYTYLLVSDNWNYGITSNSCYTKQKCLDDDEEG